MLSQKQQLKLLQKISPQQIQFIKLLQVPTINLDARIKQEIEENPALEEGETETEDSENDSYENEQDNSREEKEFNIDNYVDRDDRDYRTRLPSNADEEDYSNPIIARQTLYDGLSEQLGMLTLDSRQFLIGEHLIGTIDEDGYLRRPVSAIINDMTFRYNIPAPAENEVMSVLEMIQRFDPPGIGARDLRECLLLQLRRKNQNEDVSSAIAIVQDYFDEFTKKHFARLQTVLGIPPEKLKEVYELITHLNPKPGESQSETRHEYIVPDFIMVIEDGKIDIKLNGKNAPDLKINNSYIRMYDQYKAEQKKKKNEEIAKTLDFVKTKIESAQWFIDAIKQRQFTLLNTMHAIAEKQKDFFLSDADETKLKPMILKDIATQVKMDISTISRVANSKYVQTERGIYPLKYFFSEGIATDSGEEVSNREVKKILSDLIGSEEKKHPFSDDKLSDLLNEKGYNIARRTVAKYREQMNIPVARLRKEI